MSTSSDKDKRSDNLSPKVLVPKKNERFDNVINKLKNQCSGFNKQSSTGPESISSSKKIDDNCTNFKEYVSKDKCTADQSTSFVMSNINWTSTDDKYLNKNYLTWENSSNLCWLDASMSLLVHNKTLCHSIPKDSSTQTAKILKSYEEAISIFNDHSNDKSIEERLQNAKDILKSIQESVLEYLKPFLKCDEGKPDSAFCSLLNLISKDQEVNKKFNVRYAWHLICKKCLYSTVRNCEKPIITFNEVKHFVPYSPVSLWKCPKCETPKQEICLEYKTLPQCLIFHFENGAGKGEFDAEKLDFEVNGRKYKLSGLLTLQKGTMSFMNHFVTWIRDVITGYWLECDDLNSDVSSFTISQPTISLEDISIVAYEAIDNDGTILLKEDLGDVTVDNNDYLLIDLVDESKDGADIKTDKTDADKLKLNSSRSRKNCNESESISADSVNNQIFQFTDINDVKENIIKDDTLQKKDSLASLDSSLKFVDRENNEIFTKIIDNLLKYVEKNVEKVNPTLLDSLTCRSSNVASENNIEYNAIKESLKENVDIFKSGTENCSNEKKIFPLNISENGTSGTEYKKADDACFLQNVPLYKTTKIQVKKRGLILQTELKLGNEVQQVSENPAREITGEIKPITKHISGTEKHTICIGSTENSKNEKYFYATRSKRKKSIDNSALETIPKSRNFISRPSDNFSRQTNQRKRAIKTARNSSAPNVIKQKKTSVTEDIIMPCAKYALKDVSVVIKMLKESELSKYISSDHKDVNKLNSDNTTEKKQGAVVSASLTIDRNSVRNEDIPMPVQRHSTEELTNSIVVKGKICLGSHRKTKTQQNLPSQQLNPSKVLYNVSVSDKTIGKSTVKNLVKSQWEPIRRSSRILAHRLKSDNIIDNEGECIKKFIKESKLKQNEELPVAIVNAQTRSITEGKNKNSPVLNETEHSIKNDEFQTEISKTKSMDVCKNYSDSSLQETSKIEEETFQKEIPKRISEQIHSLCSSNLDAVTENFKDENVKSDLVNMKRKRLRKTNTYRSPVNIDFISSSNHGLVNNSTSESIQTNELNIKLTNAMHLKEFSKLSGTLPDYLNSLSESDKKKKNCSYPVNKKRCKISESIDNYNSVSEKTYEKSNVSNKVGVLASYQEKESKVIITKDSVPKLNKSLLDHSYKSFTSTEESLSYSETSRHASTKSSNDNLTSKSNNASKAISTLPSNENHDEFFSPPRRRKTRNASNCYSRSDLINNISNKDYPQLKSNFSAESSTEVEMSNQINKATDKTKAIFAASSNENLCEVSSSKRQKKTSIPRLKTISRNNSKKIVPRFDMLTPCERKSTKASCLIPSQRKMKRKNLDVNLNSVLQQFLKKNKICEKSTLTISQERYDDFSSTCNSDPLPDSVMEINSDQTNGPSTAFAPSVNGNHSKISVQKRGIRNASNLDKKSLKSLPNSNLLDSVRTNSTSERSQKKYNSNVANLKSEMLPNNSDVNIHSGRAQHHINNKMKYETDEISNLSICLERYDDIIVSSSSVPPTNSVMEINSDQMNGPSTVFAPLVNGNHNEISLRKRGIQNASNIDKKPLNSLPNSSLLDSVRTNSTSEHFQKKYNSNAPNLKREMHLNNSDVDLHSVQVQHHTNNEMEVVEKKALRDRSKRASFDTEKWIYRACERFLCQNSQNKYNSSTANLKSEMHQNTMDLNLHSVQVQHHGNNEMEIVDKEAVRKRMAKRIHKVAELTLGVVFECCEFRK